MIGASGISQVADWISFDTPGLVRVSTGKVELGQGILTALAQIAASVLEVDLARIAVVSGDTSRVPNEGYTGSSLSIETSGISIFRAAMTARRLLLAEAASALDVSVETLRVEDGAILSGGAGGATDYWRLAASVDFGAPVATDIDCPDCDLPDTLIGRDAPRIDLRDKITGAAFIHDIDLPDMLHARVVKPPSFTASLVAVDQAAFSARYPDVRLLVDGTFLAVVADSEYDAVRAAEGMPAFARWSEGDAMPRVEGWGKFLRGQDALDLVEERGEAPAINAARKLGATYSKPPIAHASIAPSCGLAQWQDGKLIVWSSSQGVFNLRNAIAKALALAPEDITVIHAQSAGCYGHNGADDAAMEAALLARAFAPRPVRLQWSREDELVWSPFGSPMAVEIDAELTADGRIADWSLELWSGTQVRRPGFLPGLVDFVGVSQLADPIPFSDPRGIPYAFVSTDRNADPLYDIPHVRTERHHLPGLPLRLSSLRALGGFANVFAIESFMDELAEAAGCDPIEFRLRHLTDPRARAVVEHAARLGWSGGVGQGFAFARYKNTAAYVALIAEIEVGDELRVLSLTGAVDAGLVINPDGVLNQIEGGAIQAASWTLLEEVTFDSRAITSNSWQSYPIIRFGEAPRVRFEIVGANRNPPCGVGEASQGPTAAAIGNAVARSLGLRLRDLPINRAQILKAASQNPGDLSNGDAT
jgi:CO/xanthine dehydrogenase Mo-binding subunit